MKGINHLYIKEKLKLIYSIFVEKCIKKMIYYKFKRLISFTKDKSIFISILIISLATIFFDANSKEINKPNYSELLDDTSFPITIGIDFNAGFSRIRDAIVPNKRYLSNPSYANAFAFLVGNTKQPNKNEQKSTTAVPPMELRNSDVFMPMIYAASAVVHFDTLILNRSIWKIFYAYPSIGIDFIYRQFVPGLPDFLGVYSGQFIGAGINLEIYKEYWADYILYPRLSIAGGYFDAPINIGKSQQLSTLRKGLTVQLKGNKEANKRFEAVAIILGIGGGFKYRFNQRWAVDIKLLTEYMFCFPIDPKKRVLIDTDSNEIKGPKYKIGDKFVPHPRRKHAFMDNILLNVGISYCINPAKTRYKRYEPPKDSIGLEIGVMGIKREMNVMSLRENQVLFTKPKPPQPTGTSQKSNDTTDKGSDMTAIFGGFGVYGSYIFKNNWLRENVSKFVFDNLSFVIGSEIIFVDNAIKNKSKKAKQSIEDSSKLSAFIGLGFMDIGFIKPKILLGCDLVSFDYWGEEKKELIIGSLFLAPEIQFTISEKLGISIFSKIRPTKNISTSGGGGLLKTFKFDLMFYELGFKIGYIF
ncbi:MAG: hypothetical protein GY830_00875 [Bacteroidetes bacterium]|nr:hypothetical protein [Bacteroidota bacterium]